MRRAVVAVLLAGALAAPAQAAPFTPHLWHVYRLAERYWGGGPINCTSLDAQIVPEGALPEGAIGWASVTDDRPRPCVLYIDRFLARPVRLAQACSTMIHELGHLRGLNHSEDPNSVMAPERKFIPGVCVRAQWAWLKLHPFAHV